MGEGTRLLALDPATTTGWALWLPGSTQACVLPHAYRRETPRGLLVGGEVSLTGRGRVNPAERLALAADWLRSAMVYVAHGRGAVAYEKPGMGRGLEAVRTACHLEAAMLLAARSMGITSLHGYAPTSVKKATAGHGRASKPDVARAVSKAWGVALEEGDAADALAVLTAHMLATDTWPE